MDMIAFYEQAKGSSHIASGKPCQDNGLFFSENGVYIAIVCDGHGSESYVRSEKGSYLAAEVAKKHILQFVNGPKSELLINHKGAVTAVPNSNPLKGVNGERVDFSSLSESQQELVKQNKSFIDESRKNENIENAFRELFSMIVKDWTARILEDSKENPFNKYEKEKLGNRRLEKAYGTTLMAAVRTDKYWFAFHIGDGKLLICNNLMEWSEPVPWDCNCFLNTTTSLCDREPQNEFRYAFDGTGKFPLAFVLGSDGLDDTFIRQDLLYKFYSQMLCVFESYDLEEALGHLRSHLTVLSKKGSHDDMSVAAIIDSCNLKMATEYFSIISKRSALNSERKEKELQINNLHSVIVEAESQVEKDRKSYHSFCKSIWISFLEMLKKREADKQEAKSMHQILKEKEAQCAKLKGQLELLEVEFDDWKNKGKQEISRLKEEADKIKESLGMTCENISIIQEDNIKSPSKAEEFFKGQ